MKTIWKDSLLQYQPDEVYFGSAVASSDACKRQINHNLHFVTDIGSDGRKHHGPFDEVGTRSPKALTDKDLPRIRDVGSQLFFARKLFDSPAANRLRAALDRRARQRWKWVEVGASIAGEWEWRGGVCDGVVQHAWSAMA